MSLRGLDPRPSAEPDEGPTGPNRLLIAAVVAVVLIAAVAVASIKGYIQLPFVGKPTITEANSALGWSIQFPKAWAKTSNSKLQPPIYYVAQGGGVGIKIQAQLLTAEMPANGTSDAAVLAELETNEKASNRPDITFIEGPGHGGLATGTIKGVPFVHYLIIYTDYSSGVPISLEDSDFYFFNGAKEEQVTLETDAKDYAKHKADFDRVIHTFTSRKITAGSTPLPTAPATTATATPSP